MTQHAIATPISIIALKDKTEIKVSRDTGERINEAILNATQHIFVKITETGETINSAEIKSIRPSVKTEYVAQPETHKPLTAEQQERRNRKLAETRKALEESGVLPKKA
jgi:hypothetical protein